MGTLHLASNIFRLMPNVRSLLRRNTCLLLNEAYGILPDLKKNQSKQILEITEHKALDFCATLLILLSQYNEEEICDYLDRLKHMIIDDGS